MNYIASLKDKVNSYKSYSQEVKDELLRTIDSIPSYIEEERYQTALKRIPAVMKITKEKLAKVKRIKKNVFRLERHAFAPELNTLWFKDGKKATVKGCTTIEEAIDMFVYNGEQFN